MSDSDTGKNGNGRGQGFNARSALCIENAKVEQSCKSPNQRETAHYETVGKVCKEKYTICHTPDSIRCFWSRLDKETQIFIACGSTIKHRRVSGANKETFNLFIIDCTGGETAPRKIM